MSNDQGHASHNMGNIGGSDTSGAIAVLLGLVVVAHSAFAATSTVVLNVDGMTGGACPVGVKKALEGLRASVARRGAGERKKHLSCSTLRWGPSLRGSIL